MNLPSTNPPAAVPAPSAYLHQLESLREEMQAAMLAISGNRLQPLEESLWRQQVLCTSLKHLSSSLSTPDLETSLAQRIRESTLALNEVSRTYSILVQQASQSGDLLLRLCRSYKDTAAPTPLPGVASPRLLCEA